METLDSIFLRVLETSAHATALAGAILLAQTLCRSHLSAAWRHALWGFLLLRLALPFSFPSPVDLHVADWLPMAELAPAPNPGQPPGTAGFTEVRGPASTPATDTAPSVGVSVVPPIEVAPPRTPSPSPEPRVETPSWSAVLAWIPEIWLVGLLVFLGRMILSQVRFRRRLRRARPVSNPAWCRVFEECRTKLGLSERVTLLQSDAVESPAVHGLLRKSLLLPETLDARFTESDLRHVFLHELAHLKRRDLELNWLGVVLQGIHWFNPFLRYAFARLRTDRELATDALALSRMPRTEGMEYGETILKLTEQLSRGRSAPALIGITEDKSDLERRIRMIAGARVGKTRPALALLLCLVLGVLGCTDLFHSNATREAEREDSASEAKLASVPPATLLRQLKQQSRWTLGPKALLFGDEDGETSAGLVRGIQIRDYPMTAEELGALGGPSAEDFPAPTSPTHAVQWNSRGQLASADGRLVLTPRPTKPDRSPEFGFETVEINRAPTSVLRFSAETCFEIDHPFRDAAGEPLITDYTVILDVMFPTLASRWAALWQTDPQNHSDAEWFISSEKGIGITDNYGGRIRPGEWHRVALVLHGSRALFTSYVDGVAAQRKPLDVKDEFFDRRRDADVVRWTRSLERLRAANDPALATEVADLSRRLTQGTAAAPAGTPLAALPSAGLDADLARLAELQARLARQPTAALVSRLESRSRWTLGRHAWLFADDNGENAGGWIDALQIRTYPMAEHEIAGLQGKPLSPEPGRDAPARAEISQWDFNGSLDSSTGSGELHPSYCPPAARAEFGFATRSDEPGAPEVLRFGRGTCFEVPTEFLRGSGPPGLQLGYSIIMDVRFDERPVGWASLWQNDDTNSHDADWFINKKGELGIRDYYGGHVEDHQWNRLALVVDGRAGTLAHFVNGRMVRSKRMILEDEWHRRGGAEPDLSGLVVLVEELASRNPSVADEAIQTFRRRMHNRPDPDGRARLVGIDVKVVQLGSGKAVGGARIDYQAADSIENFFPESIVTDRSGRGRVHVPVPVAPRVHLTVRSPGFLPVTTLVDGSSLLEGANPTVTVELSRSLRLGGVALLPDGTPMSDALLWIDHDSTMAGVCPWKDLARTGPDGSWVAAGPAADDSAVTVSLAHPSAGLQSYRFEASPGGVGDLRKLKARLQSTGKPL